MSRIHYDCSHPGKLLAADAGRLPEPRDRGISGRPLSIYEMVVGGQSTMPRFCFSVSACIRSAEPGTGPSRKSKWRRQARNHQPEYDRPACAAADHPRARVYGAPIISGHVAPTPRLPAGRRHGDEEPLDRDHGYRIQHRIDCPAIAIAYWRASCPGGTGFEVARLPAACRRSTANRGRDGGRRRRYCKWRDRRRAPRALRERTDRDPSELLRTGR